MMGLFPPCRRRATMVPSKFIAHQERRLDRPLRDDELDALHTARDDCKTGKRDTVKAMWKALEAASPSAGL